jgi:hypothetical protein
MTKPNDLSTSSGWSPFILVPTTATECQQAQALAHMYDMASTAATLHDAQLLVANDPALIPMSVGQARTCLAYLQAIIGVIGALKMCTHGRPTSERFPGGVLWRYHDVIR